jgi:hypothetical protein
VKIDSLTKKEAHKLKKGKYFSKYWIISLDSVNVNSKFAVQSYTFDATVGEMHGVLHNSECLSKDLTVFLKRIYETKIYIENIKVKDNSSDYVFNAPLIKKCIDNRPIEVIKEENYIKSLTKNYKTYCKQASESPQNDSFLWKIWEEKKIIEPGGLEYFISKDKERTLKIIKTQFIENRFPLINNDYYFEGGGWPETGNSNFNELIKKMFQMLYVQDSILACEIVNENLDECNEFKYTFFIKFINESGNKQLKDSLYVKLCDLGNPQLVLEAMKIFNNSKNKVTMKRLYEILKEFVDSKDYDDYDLECMQKGLKKYRRYK